MRGNIDAVSSGLCALIENNAATSSPRLDRHIVDITLALLFLVNAGRIEQARDWLSSLSNRLDYCFRMKSKFPVASDSLEDLVSLETGELDDEERASLMRTSWCLATIGAWCAILGLEEQYSSLADGSSDAYSNVCGQLWHPTQGWASSWYFGNALEHGYSEAPFELPSSSEELRTRMRTFLALPEYDWPKDSPSGNAGIWGLDFIACRHYRVPVPASIWFRTLPRPREESSKSPCA